MVIRYLKGDATRPVDDGSVIIAHITNNQGGWGRGFVNAISKNISVVPERAYRNDPEARILGVMQLVRVRPLLHVANMCAQNGYATKAKPVAVDLQALAVCLDKLTWAALDLHASVHCPRIGTGLGGSRWEPIEALLTQRLVAHGVPVTVYDLEQIHENLSA